MRNHVLAAALALFAVFGVTNRAVLHGRVFVWTTTGTGGTGTGGTGTGGTGTGGAAGAAGTTGTGGAAGSTGGATGGAAGTGTGGGTGGATGGVGGGTGGCGDGVRQDGEFCDGSDLQSATCASLGFSGGSLGCTSSCTFDVSSCTGGTITPTITASRTSCVAPCAVNFDATTTSGLSGGDYTGANWVWDFGDPTSTHPKAIGHVVGHVFDSPGTYAVKTRVEDLAGAAGLASTTITVSAGSWTTYYVASSGSDGNPGTIGSPFGTVQHGISQLGTNKRVLLRNGDTFTVGSSTQFIPNPVNGPALWGSYSDPGAPSSTPPIVSSSAPTAGFASIVEMDNTTDLRIVGIHFVATASAAQGFSMSTDTNSLFERVEIEGVGVGQTGTLNWNLAGVPTNIFVVDSHAHDFGGYGLYADAPAGLSIIGSNIERFTGSDHGIRVQGENGGGRFATNTFISENFISPSTPAGSSFDAAANRGDNTNTVVAWNTFTNTVSFTPQNNSVTERITQVLVEGNVLSNNTSPAVDAESWTGVNIIAKHVFVRNNQIYNPGTCVGVSGHPNLTGYPDEIFVYNNTCYMAPPAGIPTGDGFNFITLDGNHSGTGTVTVRNNIWSQGGTNPGNHFISSGGETVVQDHNLGYAPNASGTWTGAPTGTGTVIGNPLFTSTTLGSGFRLQSGSPARNAGAANAVRQDQVDVTRPKETNPSFGAYEWHP